MATRPGLQRLGLIGLSLVLLGSGSLACRPSATPDGSEPRSETRGRSQAPGGETQRQALALRQCQQRLRDLQQELKELRRSEAELADRRALPRAPLPPRPIWDELREQRYSQQDQELDRQRHQQELAVWERLEADQRALNARREQRLAEAQGRLNRQAQRLRQRYPGLFTAPTSIEVRPEILERLSRCPPPAQPEQAAAAGPEP